MLEFKCNELLEKRNIMVDLSDESAAGPDQNFLSKKLTSVLLHKNIFDEMMLFTMLDPKNCSCHR